MKKKSVAALILAAALALPAHDARSIPVLHYGNGCRTRRLRQTLLERGERLGRNATIQSENKQQ